MKLQRTWVRSPKEFQLQRARMNVDVNSASKHLSSTRFTRCFTNKNRPPRRWKNCSAVTKKLRRSRAEVCFLDKVSRSRPDIIRVRPPEFEHAGFRPSR